MARHSIPDAKNRPPSLVSAPERGERVTIAPRGKPAAELPAGR
jgi:antitoxin (DNA-binding transcriptional repressor) of toxin-antitoxin stability system